MLPIPQSARLLTDFIFSIACCFVILSCVEIYNDKNQSRICKIICNCFHHLFLQLISLGMATEANSYSLELLSQSIAKYTLLLFKVFYTTVTEALEGGLHGILCHEADIMLGSNVKVAIAQGDIAAVTRSGIPSFKSFHSFRRSHRKSRYYSNLFTFI